MKRELLSRIKLLFSYGKESPILHSKAIDNKGLNKMIYIIAVPANQSVYLWDQRIHTCHNEYFLWQSFTSCCTQEDTIFFSCSSLLPLFAFDVTMWPSFLKQILNFQFFTASVFLQNLMNIKHNISYHMKYIHMDWKFPNCKFFITEIILLLCEFHT